MKGYQFVGFCSLVLLFGCSAKQPESSVSLNKNHDLLSKYELISLDTLQVFYDSRHPEVSGFIGVELDSLDLAFFPSKLTHNVYDKFYACYSFRIDSLAYGLITRIPSMYQSSALELFLYDQQGDSVRQIASLSDEWGDAGYQTTKKSWLFKVDQQLRIFTVEMTSYDHSVNDKNDTTIERTDTAYLRTFGRSKEVLVAKDGKAAIENLRKVLLKK